MFLNSFLLLFLVFFSIFLFFIDNIYVILSFLLILGIISLFFRVKLPIYLSLIIILIINFLFNYLFSNLSDAVLVTLRLIIMFIITNLIIQKIGIYNLSNTIGNLFHSRELTLIIAISLSFVPILSKEMRMIRKSLITKNFLFNLKNILTKPSIFIVTFFMNLFKRVEEMEKVLLSKGIDE